MGVTKARGGVAPRVLTVVADRRQIEELRNLLGGAGIECEVALDLKTARHVLSTRRMDLVLVDLSLLDVKAASLIEELKNWNHDMRLVLFNGVKEKSEQRRMRRMGADSYLSKASDLRAVARAVERNL